MIWILLISALITAVNIYLIYTSQNGNANLLKAINEKLQEYREIKESIPPIVLSLELQRKIDEFDSYFEKVFKTLDESKEHVANRHPDD